MNEIKKYSFDDWWNGEVIHKDASLYDIKGADLKIVDWSDFNESDVERIKAKQLEIFKFAVDAKFKELQAQFLVRYNNSEMKKLYLLDEIKECMNILTGKIPDKEYVHFNIWGGIHENQSITDVQYYFKRNVKSGIDDGFGFVHSPNCKFQNFSKPDPRVYGRLVWEYYTWLKIFSKTERYTFNSDRTKFRLKEKDIKNKIWFKVGILFANGEIDRIISVQKDNSGINFTKIAKDLGNTSYRPYLSESWSKANKGNKNIFSNHGKLKLIYDYCNINNITMIDSFISYIK
jgi:hypothetical protein